MCEAVSFSLCNLLYPGLESGAVETGEAPGQLVVALHVVKTLRPGPCKQWKERTVKAWMSLPMLPIGR